jgi:Protein of unknown function (DUF3567)
MQIIYDSEDYAVMHVSAAPFDKPYINLAEPQAIRFPQIHDPFRQGKLSRTGFEIVDKKTGNEVYLDGSWAEMFQEKLTLWRKTEPTSEEVELTIEGYAALATQPIRMH